MAVRYLLRHLSDYGRQIVVNKTVGGGNRTHWSVREALPEATAPPPTSHRCPGPQAFRQLVDHNSIRNNESTLGLLAGYQRDLPLDGSLSDSSFPPGESRSRAKGLHLLSAWALRSECPFPKLRKMAQTIYFRRFQMVPRSDGEVLVPVHRPVQPYSLESLGLYRQNTTTNVRFATTAGVSHLKPHMDH